MFDSCSLNLDASASMQAEHQRSRHVCMQASARIRLIRSWQVLYQTAILHGLKQNPCIERHCILSGHPVWHPSCIVRQQTLQSRSEVPSSIPIIADVPSSGVFHNSMPIMIM